MENLGTFTLSKYFELAFKVSRFRFWLYLGGTYLVGYTFGIVGDFWTILNIEFFLSLFFFLIPANILLYGINDYFDFDTDQFNPKKEEKEFKKEQTSEKNLKRILLLMGLISLIYILLNFDLILSILIVGFFFLSVFYSAPPLRFKARPILDFSSNILYGFPAIIGFYQANRTIIPFEGLILIFCYTAGMHLFSAVPDISSDKQANVTTTAVKFGDKKSLVLVTIFWAIFCFMIIVITKGFIISFLFIIYPAIPLMLILRKNIDINRIYWFFPYINGAFGFGLFLFGMFSKLAII